MSRKEVILLVCVVSFSLQSKASVVASTTNETVCCSHPCVGHQIQHMSTALYLFLCLLFIAEMTSWKTPYGSWPTNRNTKKPHSDWVLISQKKADTLQQNISDKSYICNQSANLETVDVCRSMCENVPWGMTPHSTWNVLGHLQLCCTDEHTQPPTVLTGRRSFKRVLHCPAYHRGSLNGRWCRSGL